MPGPKAFPVVPPPDGGHSNDNMAEEVSNSVEIREPSPQAAASLLTLNNGVIKVGVDTTYGGAITYLSQSGSTTSLINDFDHGRQVQQSYYSGPDNFHPQAVYKIRISVHSHGIQSKLETHLEIRRKYWRTPTRTGLFTSKRDPNNGLFKIIPQIA